MITKADYEALIEELTALENDACDYLADPNIDHENVNAEWREHDYPRIFCDCLRA